MTPEIVFMLVLLGALLIFLAMEWLPIDVTALIGLVALVALGLLTPEQALSGFASEVIVMLACVFVIGGTFARSGFAHQLAEFLRGAAQSRNRLRPVLMATAAFFSAFFSNTSATAMLMPVTLQLSRQDKIPPSRLLMPLAYASILGGTCTLIGTSTNLASAGLLIRLGLEPYSLFEFVVPGVLLVIIGIVYMSTLGRRFIPEREKESLVQDYNVPDYLSELLIDEKSAAVGEALSSLKLDARGLAALAIVRNKKRLTAHGNRKLEAGDKIIVQGSRDDLLRARESKRFSIEAESTLTEQDITADSATLSEVVVVPQSRLVGKSLKQIEFHEKYRVAVLAIYRRGRAYASRISNAALRVGDVLLLQGAKAHIARLAGETDFSMLRPLARVPIGTRKGLYTLVALLGAITLTAFQALPMSMAFLAAVIFLVLTRCTTMEEAYASIEWRLIILIGCMSAFGLAMQATGTANFVADLLVQFVSPLGLHATLAGLAILTVALTQPMSNAAAALVVLPVAVSSADLMGASPYPFAVIVTLSASLSFITPLEPASLLVYGAGRYRFSDFIRAGWPLTLIVIAFLVLAVPLLWPA